MEYLMSFISTSKYYQREEWPLYNLHVRELDMLPFQGLTSKASGREEDGGWSSEHFPHQTLKQVLKNICKEMLTDTGANPIFFFSLRICFMRIQT